MTSQSPQPVELESGRPDPIIEFLREHDLSCPQCGYGLRGETTHLCPRCHEDIRDAVTATTMLLRFLHNRNVDCPRCGYNVRNLTQPVCPECHESLMLRVGVQRIVVHWLLLTVAPGIFCAIALTCFGVMVLIHGPPGRAPWQAILTMTFMGFSAVVGLLISLNYRTFLRWSNSMQRTCAAIAWLIHLIAFGLVVSSV